VKHDTEFEDCDTHELRKRGVANVVIVMSMFMVVSVVVLMAGFPRCFLDV
jgi:hypothetical protein